MRRKENRTHEHENRKKEKYDAYQTDGIEVWDKQEARWKISKNKKRVEKPQNWKGAMRQWVEEAGNPDFDHSRDEGMATSLVLEGHITRA